MGLMRGIQDRADRIGQQVTETGETVSAGVERAAEVITIVGLVAVAALLLSTVALVVARADR